MRIDGFFLAEFAKPEPGGGVTAVNGGWTTWNVTEPLTLPEPAPDPAPVAVISGAVVARVMLTPEESDGQHALVLRLVDADQGELFRVDVMLAANRDPELPRSWEQQAVLILPLQGLPIPTFGLHRLMLESTDGLPLAACPFQVVKRYQG
jgi:hypothetical protein